MKKYEMKVEDENNIEFTIKNDVLNRRKELINLARYLNAINENYIISIDGKWGCGKTFFVKQLQYIIENDCKDLFSASDYKIIENIKNRYIPVYYNAWANDDHDNVIESLIVNMFNQFPKFKHQVKINKEDFRRILENIEKNIIAKGTLGILSKDVLDNIKDIDSFANNVITYEEKKDCLNSVINEIIKDDYRLLLIIDELDRCKPDFAIKVLETIKHFYNNDKITIIVSTNNQQLSSSIRKFYGYDFDGYSYLNKMYDGVISLNLIKRNKYLESYCKFYNAADFNSQIAYFLIDYYNFGLRECNRFVSMYNICYGYITQEDSFEQEKWMMHSMFLIVGIVLKIIDINQYNKFVLGNDDIFVKELVNKIIEEKPNYKNYFNKYYKTDTGDYNDKIIEIYHEIFNNKKGTRLYPINEALTFVGDNIIIEDE